MLKFLILWSDEINHSNFENATKCLNKSWWYLLKHACFILKLKDFCNTCVHFQWKKTNSSRHIGILSALRMRGLHDKRQLLAKLRIAGSENYWLLTHSERRPQNIYSQQEINLYCIIKLATEISLFSLQISKLSLMFCVDKIKYENLAIISDLKSCQFVPRIVNFNLCICCQFEDSQIILPKIIPMSHRNI